MSKIGARCHEKPKFFMVRMAIPIVNLGNKKRKKKRQLSLSSATLPPNEPPKKKKIAMKNLNSSWLRRPSSSLAFFLMKI